MIRQPLAEVFGFPITNLSADAQYYRDNQLCRFTKKSCTKDKADDPLGTCSIYHSDKPVITCPMRFREDGIIFRDAAEFFFDPNTTWTAISEVRLHDAQGQTAGNIDIVLVAHDDQGQILDFGAIEIQSVYISGNVRVIFQDYIADPQNYLTKDWSSQPNYPRPDFLSSSRKRLAPQLIYKGGILHQWKKKLAVVLDQSFFNTLPKLPVVTRKDAEMVWLVYDLDRNINPFRLRKVDEIYTKFQDALETIVQPTAGDFNAFITMLRTKLDKRIL